MELKTILAIGLCLFIAGGAVLLFIRNKKKDKIKSDGLTRPFLFGGSNEYERCA
jgi:hypothetical protein